MRVLVYPHELVIGGSQINAVDLAAEIRELGHEAIVYGQPGPLVPYVTEEKGLAFVAARQLRYRPAPSRIVQLARLAARERIDLIHTYEWPPCLDAFYGANLFSSVPVVCTVLSMGFVPLIPTTVPLLMGTHELAEGVRRQWSGSVGVMEPPIDTVKDNPANDGTKFRAEHGIAGDELLVVSVSRLSLDLKLDALTDVIDGVARLADRHPVRLVLVGEGDAVSQLTQRAASVNAAVGRPVVELPGPMLDPRPAYAAADVVAGMGSSALRAMAHGKPVVVQGERGFARVFDEESAEQFFWGGFYGLGSGGSAAAEVEAALEPLLADESLRRKLGHHGVRVVNDRFSLRAAAKQMCELYERTSAAPASKATALRQAVSVGAGALALEARLHAPSHRRRHEVAAAKLANASVYPAERPG